MTTTTESTDGINESSDSTDEQVKQLLLMIPLCLLVGNVLRHICIEFRLILPYTALLLLVGMIFGWIEQHISKSTIFGGAVDLIQTLNPDLLLAIFIPPLVFESAFGTDYHIIRREFIQAILLAGPGVILNTIFTSIFCYYVFPYNWSWAEALTFSSIISATDPVAVVSLLRELGASPKLATLIEGESLLNDGSAFVLFVVMSRFITDSSPPTAINIVGQFVSLTFGGIIIGIIVGIIVILWIRLVFNDARIEIVITVIACYLTYWWCEDGFFENIHASGVLGCVFLGLCVSKYKSAITPSVHESMHAFWEVLSYIANTLVFIFSGMIIVLSVFKSRSTSDAVNICDLGYNILLLIMLHIARILTILTLYYPLKYSGFGINWKQIIVLVFGGLRGVIGLSLALIIKLDNRYSASYQHQVLFHIAVIVFWTLILNATSMQYIVHYLGLTKLKKDAIPVLKAEMAILESQTKDKIEGMKGDPAYAGANWHDVVATLPSYASILSNNVEKHQNKLKRMLTTRTVTKCDIKDVEKIVGFYPESKYMSMRFMDLDEYENEPVETIEENESEEWSQPLLTPINTDKSGNEIKARFNFDDDNFISDETKEFDPLSDVYSLQSNPNLKPMASLLDAKLPSLRMAMNSTNLPKSEKMVNISTKELQHRVLSILQTSFDNAFEEGIISLDSYMILKNGINCALDDTDIKILEKHIYSVFEINKCFENIYTKFNNIRLIRFLLLHELKRAIEVGLIFIESVEELRGKISCVPLISKSYKLAPILNLLNSVVEQVEHKWLHIQHKYPEVYAGIQTRLAVNTIIEHEQNEIQQLYNYGLLDEREYSKMIQLLQQTQHRLYYSSWNYVTKIHLSKDDMKQTIRSVVWISKLKHDNDIQHEKKLQYIFKNMIHHKYNKNDIIVKKNEFINGIHIIVSGQCTVNIIDEKEENNNLLNIQANEQINLYDDTQQDDNDNKTQQISTKRSETFTKGVFFPAWAYLTQQPSQYSIHTDTTVETCFLSNDIMTYLLEDKDLNEITEKDAYLSLWKSCASYLLWLKHKHVKRGNIIDAFFHTLSKTEISIMCQKSTFKQFDSQHEDDRMYLNSSYLMILLYGKCFYYQNNNYNKKEKHTFNSGDMLLPYPRPYIFEKGSKILVLDYNIKHSLPSPMKRINRTFTFRKL
eukprot:547147_1